jgi:lipopolysaccharide export system protein LptA
MPPPSRERRVRGAVATLLGLLTALYLPASQPAAPARTVERIHATYKAASGSGDDGTLAMETVVLTEENPTMLIRADKAEASGLSGGSFANGRWVLTGKVHIEYEQAVMDANSATVVFVDNLIRSIEVRGVPAKFSHAGKVAGQPYLGSAQVIAFDGPKRTVRFTGHSWYSTGALEGNSDKPLLYELDTGSFRSEKAAGTAAQVLTIRAGERQFHATYEGMAGNGNDGTLVLENMTLTEENPDMQMSADRAEASGLAGGSFSSSRWILSGRMHIDYQKAAMDADNASVVFADGLIRSIDVHGAPARFSHPGKVVGQPYLGTAQAIAFDGMKRQVRFTGHSWFSYRACEGTSEKPLVYDLESGSFRNEKADSAPPISASCRREKPAGQQRIPTPRAPGRSTAR